PVVIHRGVVSTMERFVAFLIEEYKGAFPTWLAPVQVKVIPVSPDAHLDYAKSVADKLRRQAVRVEVDDRDEKIGYKIREAQTEKVPFAIVDGNREVQDDAVNEKRYGQKHSETLDYETFEQLILCEINEKSLRNSLFKHPRQ